MTSHGESFSATTIISMDFSRVPFSWPLWLSKWGLPSSEIGNCVLTAVKAPSCPRTKLCCLLLISELVAEVGFSCDYHQKSPPRGPPGQGFPVGSPSLQPPTLTVCCIILLVRAVVLLAQLKTCTYNQEWVDLDIGHLLYVWRCSHEAAQDSLWLAFVFVAVVTYHMNFLEEEKWQTMFSPNKITGTSLSTKMRPDL